MKNTNIALALLAGAAAGTLIGMLIAPASGRDTRQKIVQKTVSAKDSIGYRILQLEELLAKMRKKVETAEEPLSQG